MTAATRPSLWRCLVYFGLLIGASVSHAAFADDEIDCQKYHGANPDTDTLKIYKSVDESYEVTVKYDPAYLWPLGERCGKRRICSGRRFGIDMISGDPVVFSNYEYINDPKNYTHVSLIVSGLDVGRFEGILPVLFNRPANLFDKEEQYYDFEVLDYEIQGFKVIDYIKDYPNKNIENYRAKQEVGVKFNNVGKIKEIIRCMKRINYLINPQCTVYLRESPFRAHFYFNRTNLVYLDRTIGYVREFIFCLVEG